MLAAELKPLHTANAHIEAIPHGWNLRLSASQESKYQLAQLDNYHQLVRRDFGHQWPLTFALRARASHKDLPGTWGFGLWNDPFGLSLGFGGRAWRLPALPNAAWFFFASPQNHLALRTELPGSGQLAAVFRSPRIPSLLLAPAALALPMLALRPASRWLRKQTARLVAQDAVSLGLDLDPTIWHDYTLNWQSDFVEFTIDERVVLRTSISPRGPLGLVLWIDNQFAAWRPDGGIGYGVLPTQDSWLEIQDLRLN